MGVPANYDVFLRAADLNWAYQCGEDTARGDCTAEPEFAQRCANDEEALLEYYRGFASQVKRQTKLQTEQ